MIHIDITDAAKKYLEAYVNEYPKTIGLRLSVNTKGCNGMSYVIAFFEQKSLWDLPTHSEYVFIDVMAQEILAGATLDYIDDPLDKRFKIINNKEKGQCGCGASFNI